MKALNDFTFKVLGCFDSVDRTDGVAVNSLFGDIYQYVPVDDYAAALRREKEWMQKYYAAANERDRAQTFCESALDQHPKKKHLAAILPWKNNGVK
jgi:hypothetical protein